MGLKQYETRGKNPGKTAYRGKLLIHASKQKPDDRDGTISQIAFALHSAKPEKSPEQWFYEIATVPLGCVVAIVDLVDSRKMVAADSFAPTSEPTISINRQTALERAVGDWQPGRYALKLENVIALPRPIYCNGGQGLRIPGSSVVESVTENIRTVLESKL